ncbi:hypothetical protein SH668x_001027 [Planctomicrobium sp. SH668]|uniref:hypothetical protein n=1 Tax=Planctomicrobium sp. SH668 TaxID=3448126 RepID=UPI003F5C334C
MLIGLDLDSAVYEHPEFFRHFIAAMTTAGNRFICISNHLKGEWYAEDEDRLRSLGIKPEQISPEHLRRDEESEESANDYKARLSTMCSYVFDGDGAAYQKLTKTPILIMPKRESQHPDLLAMGQTMTCTVKELNSLLSRKYSVLKHAANLRGKKLQMSRQQFIRSERKRMTVKKRA